MTAPCPIFGFLVELEVDEQLSSGQSDGVWRSFMDLTRRRGLEADGGRGRRLWTYRLLGESAQASDLDRTAVRAWAATHPEIVDVRVGELFDVSSTV